MSTSEEQIRELLAAATPGPWRWEGDYPRTAPCIHDTEWADHGPYLRAETDRVASASGSDDASQLDVGDADAAFIAAAPEAVAFLLAEAASLREQVAAKDAAELAAFRTAMALRIKDELVCGCVEDRPGDSSAWCSGLCRGAAFASLLVNPAVAVNWIPTPADWTPAVQRHYASLRIESYGPTPAAVRTHREPSCVAKWPDRQNGEHIPSCCRWPKSCSVQDVPIAHEDCGHCGYASAGQSWESKCAWPAYAPVCPEGATNV